MKIKKEEVVMIKKGGSWRAFELLEDVAVKELATEQIMAGAPTEEKTGVGITGPMRSIGNNQLDQ